MPTAAKQGRQKRRRRNMAAVEGTVYNERADEIRTHALESSLQRSCCVPIVSILFGLLLIALGVWGRFGGVLGLWEPLGLTAPDHLSGTALIPAYVGAALILCGFLAFKASLLKHAMHAAAMVGVLGLVAALGRIVSTGKIQGVGGVSLTAMAVLCGVFVALCVNSFIQVRRRRRAAAPTVGP